MDYLREIEIPVGLRNDRARRIRVDQVSLRFQSERRKSDPDTTITAHPENFVVEHLEDRKIMVVPNLLFLPGTNEFEVVVKFREEHKGKLGRQLTVRKDRAGFIVVKEVARGMYGKVFISFKDDEDRGLADDLKKLCTRAGFEAYIAPENLQPGSDIWEQKIPPKIKESALIFVIWTRNTEKGVGVQRELKLARTFGVKEVPLLERNIPPPKLFNEKLERERFDPLNAEVRFSEVVAACRRMC